MVFEMVLVFVYDIGINIIRNIKIIDYIVILYVSISN